MAKAKANAVQALPEIIENAFNKKHEVNRKMKHNKDAYQGWYRYESRFAIPAINDLGEVERYNVFHILILMRCSKEGKLFLYDIIQIKKETSNLFQSNDYTQ